MAATTDQIKFVKEYAGWYESSNKAACDEEIRNYECAFENPNQRYLNEWRFVIWKFDASWDEPLLGARTGDWILEAAKPGQIATSIVGDEPFATLAEAKRQAQYCVEVA